MQNQIYTADELAEELQVKPETVRSWARQRLIPSLRPTAKVLRFDRRDVMEALRKRASQQEEVGSGS